MTLLILLHVKTHGSYSHSLVIVIIQLYEKTHGSILKSQFKYILKNLN